MQDEDRGNGTDASVRALRSITFVSRLAHHLSEAGWCITLVGRLVNHVRGPAREIAPRCLADRSEHSSVKEIPKDLLCSETSMSTGMWHRIWLRLPRMCFAMFAVICPFWLQSEHLLWDGHDRSTTVRS